MFPVTYLFQFRKIALLILFCNIFQCIALANLISLIKYCRYYHGNRVTAKLLCIIYYVSEFAWRIFKNTFLLVLKAREGNIEVRRKHWSVASFLPHVPQQGIQPTTWTYALAGNQTEIFPCTLSCSNQLSHASWGERIF